MNRIIITLMIVAAGMLLPGACSRADRDDRQAARYAERLETGKDVSAREYDDMVEFYCGALDRTLRDIEPAAKAYAAAVEADDSVAARRTVLELNRATAEAYEKRRNLVRLGSNLQARLPNLPDSTRNRLVEHIMKVTLKYSDFH